MVVYDCIPELGSRAHILAQNNSRYADSLLTNPYLGRLKADGGSTGKSYALMNRAELEEMEKIDDFHSPDRLHDNNDEEGEQFMATFFSHSEVVKDSLRAVRFIRQVEERAKRIWRSAYFVCWRCFSLPRIHLELANGRKKD